jgi:hypothetical protein
MYLFLSVGSVVMAMQHVYGQIQNMVIICSDPTNQTVQCCTHDELLVRPCLNQEQIQFTSPSVVGPKGPHGTQNVTTLLSQIRDDQKLMIKLQQGNMNILGMKLDVISKQLNQIDSRLSQLVNQTHG